MRGMWAHERTHAGQSWTLFPNKALSLSLSGSLVMDIVPNEALSLCLSLSLSQGAREQSRYLGLRSGFDLGGGREGGPAGCRQSRGAMHAPCPTSGWGGLV